MMWASRLADRREIAWYNDPADPGIVTNETFRADNLNVLKDAFVAKVKVATAILNKPKPRSEPSESIEEAINNLLKIILAASDQLPRELSGYDGNFACDLLDAAEDVSEWLDGIAEANQTPAQMGWVGRNGQP